MPELSIKKNYLGDADFDVQSNRFQFLLSYFDGNQGPIIFLASPPDVSPSIQDLVTRLLDVNVIEGFFEHKLENKRVILGNYIFHIPSEWARGNTELLMISVALPRQQIVSLFKPQLQKFVDFFSAIPNIYKAFYAKGPKEKDDPEIATLFNILNQVFFDYALFFSEYANFLHLGKILVVGEPDIGINLLIRALSTDVFEEYQDLLKQKIFLKESIAVKNFFNDTTPNLQINKKPPSNNSENPEYLEKSKSEQLMLQEFDAKIKEKFTRHLGLRILNSPLNPSIGKILYDFVLNGVDFFIYDLIPNMPSSMWMNLCPRPLAIFFILDGARPLAEQYAVNEFDKIVFHYYSEYSDAFIGLNNPFAILVHTPENNSKFTEKELVQILNLSNSALKWKVFFLNLSNQERVYDVWNWVLQDIIGLMDHKNITQN